MKHRVLLAVLLLTPTLAAAQPREAERAVLPGLIVDAATVPRDARGLPDETRIRGARAWRPTVAGDATRAALAAQRDAAAGRAGGADFVASRPLAGDARAPARVDAGDPDPDRLHSPAPPPVR